MVYDLGGGGVWMALHKGKMGERSDQLSFWHRVSSSSLTVVYNLGGGRGLYGGEGGEGGV